MVILFNVLNKVEIDYLKLKKKLKFRLSGVLIYIYSFSGWMFFLVCF